MFQKITLLCEYEPAQKSNYNWGSILHGALMELLPPDVTDYIHQIQLRPFSQYILPDAENRLSWHIGLWDNAIAANITEVILPLAEFHLKQKGLRLRVIEARKHSTTEHDYFNRFFSTLVPCRRFEITFLTPCTHKQNGKYTVFPDLELMIQSLSMRYNAFASDYSLDDTEAMHHLAQHLQIVRYSLHSAVYHLENTRITGFMGKITIIVSGPEQLARLAGALISFGEYSGLGIKTALGMGAISVKEIPKQV